MDAFVKSTLPREGDSPRKLTEDELASIQDILDCAYAWSRNEMPLDAVMDLGIVLYDGHPSPAYSRWLAIGTTSRSDPRWAALVQMVDHMIRHDRNFVVTRQGVYQPLEMTMHHQSVAFVRAHPTSEAA